MTICADEWVYANPSHRHPEKHRLALSSYGNSTQDTEHACLTTQIVTNNNKERYSLLSVVQATHQQEMGIVEIKLCCNQT